MNKTCGNCLYSKAGREGKSFCREHFVEVEDTASCHCWTGYKVYEKGKEDEIPSR